MIAAVEGMPDVIAHRGASAYEPEHTFAAYDAALRMGADVLEVDVRLTADGVPVVLHDATLARTTGDPRAISTVTARQIDALETEARPLRLADVLERYEDGTRYLLDLKEPRGEVASAVIEAVLGAGLFRRVQIQAFSRRGLRRVRAAHGLVSIAQLYVPRFPAAAIRRDLGRVERLADSIGPHAAGVDAALVAAAHRRGLRVQPYTVNDRAEIAWLSALGVDAIITDAPDLMRAPIETRRPLAVA